MCPTGEDDNSVCQAHKGHTYTGICADTMMLLVWGGLQKFPSTKSFTRALWICLAAEAITLKSIGSILNTRNTDSDAL